jgi:hypothetical protein
MRMAVPEGFARLGPYAQRLAENEYLQENLRDAVRNLREAHSRAQKRRVKAARDERVQRRLQAAALSIAEAGRALRGDRRKPKPRWGRRLLVLVGVGAVGVGVAIAASEELRASILGSDSPGQPTDEAAPAGTPVATPA